MPKIEKKVKAIKYGVRGLGINIPKVMREVLNIDENTYFSVSLDTGHLSKKKIIILTLLDTKEKKDE